MARYKDAVCKLCRREGEKLFLKGERCMSPKCGFERRPYAPGLHGRSAQYRRKQSDYSKQLRAKQKASGRKVVSFPPKRVKPPPPDPS